MLYEKLNVKRPNIKNSVIHFMTEKIVPVSLLKNELHAVGYLLLKQS